MLEFQSSKGKKDIIQTNSYFKKLNDLYTSIGER